MRILNCLIKAIRSAAVHNPDVQAAPACILWPDGDRQWEPVAELAKVTSQSLAAGQPKDMASAYQAGAWRADAAVIAALAGVQKLEDVQAVQAAIRTVYLPWCDDAARHLQSRVATAGYPGVKPTKRPSKTNGDGPCILFADGLRFDLAKSLETMLANSGCSVEPQTGWAALPSVTATGKPAVSPVRHLIAGQDINVDFEPTVAETGQSLRGGYHLRKLLGDEGWQVLGRTECGDPQGKAWTEAGDIDHQGHERGWQLAKHLERILADIRDRVLQLLQVGWKTVQIVSDHGWLLLPGGLPKTELPSALSENTWGRCAVIAQEKNGRPFGIEGLREIQLSKRDVLDDLAAARTQFSTADWKTLLLRSIGIESAGLSERAKDAFLLRMVPFVERNYNLVELGPRGTGKSHLFQQISPYAHLISGGKATVARMFVNNATGQRGLVCQYDVVCFDEVSGISFDQKDGVNIMKGYMESGEFSRGKESIRADGSIVLVGNFEVDVEHQQRIGHLLGPMPPEMRDDTAFMDRIHGYLPGWDVPKVSKELLTDHFGLVSDFLSECWSQLRNQSRVASLQGRVHFGGALSGRDTNAVNKTVSGLLKLLYPSSAMAVPDADLEWTVRLALESRRRVKEQQKRIGAAEFRNTHFSYVMGSDGVERFVSTPELQSEDGIGSDPLEPGQAWTISPGGQDEHPGLYRIEVNEGPGSGVRILNKPVPTAFRESVAYAEQNLYARAAQLVGDKDPRQHEFSVQLRAFDASKSGAKLGIAILVAMCTALLKKTTRGGLIIIGEINLGGSIEPIHNAVTVAEMAVEKGATALLMPVACRRQLFDLSDDMATKVDIQFFTDGREALLKAIQE